MLNLIIRKVNKQKLQNNKNNKNKQLYKQTLTQKTNKIMNKVRVCNIKYGAYLQILLISTIIRLCNGIIITKNIK
jgi:hypothetical protein